MRIRFLFLLLALGSAVPAAAQPPVERRVDRLEQEMRAVQRRVFPGGPAATLDPEIGTQTPASRPAAETSDAISSLTARIDALEAQLAGITGQVEENGHRLSQLERQVTQLRTDFQNRMTRLEQAAAPPQPVAPPQVEPPATEPVAPGPDSPAAGTRPLDPVQAAYNDGYRLWEQRRFADAAQALTALAQRSPNSRWASWARNLAGRAHLDDGQPATAARVFLENYQANPRGERAADSLFYLGEALVKLNRRTEACPVYDELAAKYPDMRAFLRERLPAARRAARCS
jgi:TolA-binding protein